MNNDFGVIVLYVVICIFALYTLFVVVPVAAVAERDCLRAGYPKSQVTYNLERYCTTLDGAVTVRVDRIEKAKEGK